MTNDISPHELDQMWLHERGDFTENQIEYFCERVAIIITQGKASEGRARYTALSLLREKIRKGSLE